MDLWRIAIAISESADEVTRRALQSYVHLLRWMVQADRARLVFSVDRVDMETINLCVQFPTSDGMIASWEGRRHDGNTFPTSCFHWPHDDDDTYLTHNRWAKLLPDCADHETQPSALFEGAWLWDWYPAWLDSVDRHVLEIVDAVCEGRIEGPEPDLRLRAFEVIRSRSPTYDGAVRALQVIDDCGLSFLDNCVELSPWGAPVSASLPKDIPVHPTVDFSALGALVNDWQAAPFGYQRQCLVDCIVCPLLIACPATPRSVLEQIARAGRHNELLARCALVDEDLRALAALSGGKAPAPELAVDGVLSWPGGLASKFAAQGPLTQAEERLIQALRCLREDLSEQRSPSGAAYDRAIERLVLSAWPAVMAWNLTEGWTRLPDTSVADSLATLVEQYHGYFTSPMGQAHSIGEIESFIRDAWASFVG